MHSTVRTAHTAAASERCDRADAFLDVFREQSSSVAPLAPAAAIDHQRSGGVRVHIGNVSVTEDPQSGTVRVRLVPEVFFDDYYHHQHHQQQHHQSSSGNRLSPHDLLKEDHFEAPSGGRRLLRRLVLCSDAVTPGEVKSLVAAAGSSSVETEAAEDEEMWRVCHAAAAFNEFSTLDLALRAHSPLVLHAWLAWEEEEEEEEDSDNKNKNNRRRRRRKVTGSDTVFAFRTRRDAHDGPLRFAARGLRSEDFHCGARLILPVISSSSASSSSSNNNNKNNNIVNVDVDDNSPSTLTILSVALSGEGALQGSVAAFCRQQRLPFKGECAQLAARVADAAAKVAAVKALGLPPVQGAPPSPREPFVFLHHEKCAGTSLRRYIATAARRLGLEIHVRTRKKQESDALFIFRIVPRRVCYASFHNYSLPSCSSFLSFFLSFHLSFHF